MDRCERYHVAESCTDLRQIYLIVYIIIMPHFDFRLRGAPPRTSAGAPAPDSIVQVGPNTGPLLPSHRPNAFVLMLKHILILI